MSVTLIVKAWTKDWYSKNILIQDEKQVRMYDVGLKDSADGLRLYPSDFPEAEFFTITLREDRR